MVGADKTQWSPHIHALEGENSDSLSEFSCFGSFLEDQRSSPSGVPSLDA